MWTVWPVVGASMIRPLPRYMPTWPGASLVPSAPGTNTRSPGRSWVMSGTGVPAWNCSLLVRGRLTPAAFHACCIRLEQSHWWAGSPPCALVQSPPKLYGVPSWANAHRIAAATAGGVSGDRVNPDGTACRLFGSQAVASADGTAKPVIAATMRVAAGSHCADAMGVARGGAA